MLKAIFSVLLSCHLAIPLLATSQPLFSLPSLWTILPDTPHPATRLNVTLGLRQNKQGLAALHSTLLNISNPQHPDYGQWLSKQHVETLVSADALDVQRVIAWIHATCGTNTTVERLGSDALLIKDATVRQMETLFNITIHHVVPSFGSNKRPRLRATNGGIHGAIPKQFKHTIEIITPIFNFIPRQRPRLRPRQQQQHPPTTTTSSTTDPSIVPQTILNLYNITNQVSPVSLVAQGTHRSSFNPSVQAVAEMQHSLGPEGFDKNDINLYQQTFQLNHSLLPTTVVGINDGIDPTGECTMDTDLVGAVAQGSPTIFWLVDEWMYELGLELSTYNDTLPDVMSISWGFAETRQCGPTDYGPNMPANCTYLGISSNTSYVKRTNVEFMKLSARGMTLIASSGDSGAPGTINDDCAHDETPTHALNPSYPGSSPYVLSVGATQLLSFDPLDTPVKPTPCKAGFLWKGFKCASNGTEQTASVETGALITTGGGFSVYSPRPTWQDKAVKNYLNQAAQLPPTNRFNASNRAYPDVSAIGHNVLVYLKGTGSRGWSNFDGTSASAPVWAGIITLLNDLRKRQNKTTLGMVAPMLYAMYSSGSGSGGGGYGFTDIYRHGGNNKCTRANGEVETPKTPTCCAYGYNSFKNGWDPVNGLGVPRFSQLVHYVQEHLP